MKMTEADGPVDMRLEVVVIGVSDFDRAKAFYGKLGWRLDADISRGDFRAVQFTPYHSQCSIIFGTGITSPKPGALKNLTIAVPDVNAARNELTSRGAKVSDVFTFAAGPFNDLGKNPRVNGRDPEGRSYFSFASFEDPDGNQWLLQEITSRLPNREWEQIHGRSVNVGTIAELLHETSEHHDHYEKTHAEHHWWDWYAAYFNARQNGKNSDEATVDAGRYMDEVHHVARLSKG